MAANQQQIDNLVSLLDGYATKGGDADNNTVLISGGSISKKTVDSLSTYVHYITGGTSVEGAANGNTVRITGGTHNVDSLYGGDSVIGTSAENNTIYVDAAGSKFANIFGGVSSGGKSSGNSIHIVNGDVKTQIIGGWSTTGYRIPLCLRISEYI